MIKLANEMILKTEKNILVKMNLLIHEINEIYSSTRQRHPELTLFKNCQNINN